MPTFALKHAYTPEVFSFWDTHRIYVLTKGLEKLTKIINSDMPGKNLSVMYIYLVYGYQFFIAWIGKIFLEFLTNPYFTKLILISFF